MQDDNKRPGDNPTHPGHADRPNANPVDAAHPDNTGEYPSGQGHPENTSHPGSSVGDRGPGNMSPGAGDPTGMATDMNQAGSVPGGQGNVGDRAGQVGSQGWSEGEDPTQDAEAGAFQHDRGPVGGDGGAEEPEETAETNKDNWRGGGV